MVDAFKLFSDKKEETKRIIVIDEFQYLGKTDPSFPSIMQKIWDTVLRNKNIMLILCGSLISLMQKQTLEYSSPLYGRRTAQIKLKQIDFKDYGEFFDGKSMKELLPFYSITGGVPKYIESISESGNVYEEIYENILNPQSYLFEEPYFLLSNEVNEIGSYFSLIKAIAMGNRKLSDISTYLGVKQTNLSKYLKTLNDLDLIEREVPITEVNPEKSKSGLYRIKDNFISFWFKFVYPYKSFLERGEREFILHKIEETFVQNYVSYIYEDLCRERIWDFMKEDDFKESYDRVGRYWGPICGEIDILSIDSVNKRIMIGECKYTKSEKELSILHDLKEKAKKLEERLGYKCDKYIIFSTGGFSKDLIDERKK